MGKTDRAPDGGKTERKNGKGKCGEHTKRYSSPNARILYKKYFNKDL